MAVSPESFASATGPIPIDVYLPASSGKHRAVLILHGTGGLENPWGADIESFAEGLSKKGLAAAIPRYFTSTHTKAGQEAYNLMLEKLPDWKTACGAALAFMAADARFDATRLGLVGFSLGGHLALSLAMGRPAGANVKAVVDFFAPTIIPALQGTWSALPPLQIHHGTDDPLTIKNSLQLVEKIEAPGRPVTRLTFGKPAGGPVADDQFIEYPGQKHGFTGAALTGAREATIQFLDAHLT